jgi:FtsP/CotA-like multicopper oxidase with cupredoxin domain
MLRRPHLAAFVMPVLFATPLGSLVACGDDEPDSANTSSGGSRKESGTSAHDAGAAGVTGGVAGSSDSIPEAEAGRAGDAGGGNQRPGLDLSSVALTEAEDLDPDPDVVEVALHAGSEDIQIGDTSYELWAYNGSVPGPIIRARRGQKLVVRFTNHLEEDTTIHWHGVRVPNDMDGTPMVQQPIAPGASFDYAFDLLDGGMTWFHPHLNTPEQVMRGLYAPLVVEEPDDPRNLGTELVLVLSDLAFDAQGEPGFHDHDPASLVNGREGSVALVNGKIEPEITVPAGARLRLRLLNAAGARYFNLHLAQHKLLRIGGDGGLMSEAAELDELLLTNGERAEVLLTPQGEPGDVLTLQSLAYNRGAPLSSEQPIPLLKIRLAEPLAAAPPELPSMLRDIEPLSADGATQVTLDFSLQGTTFKVNGVPGTEAPHLMAHVGETQHWTVKNNTTYDHPFHVHGFFFQVVDPVTGEPRAPVEWKDTVNLPQTGELQLLIRYDDRPGMWMHHCHILDHAEVGFMQMLHVMP